MCNAYLLGMKTLLSLIALLSVISFGGSCSKKTGGPTGENAQSAVPVGDKYLSGEVLEVQPGKDGYTAKLVTPDKQVYFATISRANLKENTAQYRAVAVGETIRVKGDVWKMGNESHVTVRELQ